MRRVNFFLIIAFESIAVKMTNGRLSLTFRDIMEIGKMYKVNRFSFFQMHRNDSIESYIEFQIDAGPVFMPEHSFPAIRMYPPDTQFYLLCTSKDYLPHGIQFSIKIFVDDGEDDDIIVDSDTDDE